MAERTIKTKLLVRTDTSANWESENPILQANEFGFDSTVQAFKKGDGTTTWKNLEYVTDIRLANKNEISNANERVYLVIGNTTGTAGTWTGTNERITSYFDGLVVNYKIGVEGGSSTTTLNINGLGAKTVYRLGTSKVTTHYAVGTMVLLSYNASKGAFYSADYDANSYAYVRQYKTTTDAEYPMLMAYETTIPSSYDTKYVRKNSTIKANPSTGTITATTFNGNATSSTKATQDGNGNVISETYATKEELENASGGTIDDSNYAKLNANNNFTGNNTFVGQLTFQDLLIPSGSGMQVSGVFADKNGSIGSSGQVLTSTGTGVQWTTPSSSGESGGSSSGVTSYPLIDLGGNSIYESPIAGIITLENINKIIQAGGFISEIDHNDIGMVKPFIINYITDTEISLDMRIEYFEDGYSEFFACWIDRENLEYTVYFATTPIISQNNFDNIAFKSLDNTFSGDNTFEGITTIASLNASNGVGTNGQVLTSTGSGVRWSTPSSSGGSSSRTIIYASQNTTAYSVAFYENQDEGGYNLDITLNLPNSYFKLDLSEIEQIEDIDLSRVKRLNIRSNYNDVKVFLYTSNYNNIQFDYPYFTFNCSNGLLFVENGSVSDGNIYIDGANNYIGDDNYIQLYCEHNIFQYTFYAYYDEIGNCHISYSFNGYEV